MPTIRRPAKQVSEMTDEELKEYKEPSAEEGDLSDYWIPGLAKAPVKALAKWTINKAERAGAQAVQEKLTDGAEMPAMGAGANAMALGIKGEKPQGPPKRDEKDPYRLTKNPRPGEDLTLPQARGQEPSITKETIEKMRQPTAPPPPAPKPPERVLNMGNLKTEREKALGEYGPNATVSPYKSTSQELAEKRAKIGEGSPLSTGYDWSQMNKPKGTIRKTK